MKIKNWKAKLAIVTSLAIILTSVTTTPVLAFTESVSSNNENNVQVDIKQIKEIANVNFSGAGYTGTPSQSLAENVALLVDQDGSGHGYNAHDVLKYLYPNDSDAQLQKEAVSAEQAVSWLNSVGYTANVVNRALTTDEIKKSLDASEPIITVLENQDSSYWLEPVSSGILYAHDDVSAGDQQLLHQSFIKTFNHNEVFIKDGEETNSFQFTDMKDAPDETARNSSFKWTQSIVDIKKDPTWDSKENIRGDRASGSFNVDVTKEGTNITQVDFTDQDVQDLWHKYDKDNTTSTTQLSALALINLYFDEQHQKTVSDMDKYLKISDTTDVTVQQIEDWYKSLGFEFDTASGKLSKDITKTANSKGELYLSVFNNLDATNSVKHTSAIGAGFADNSSGYMPRWQDVRDWEQLSENYVVDWSKPNAMDTMIQNWKNYNYDNFRVLGGEWGENVKGLFNTNEVIYNIHAKDKPSTDGQTPFSLSTSTSASDLQKSVTQTQGNFITAQDFGVRETQGQQPWCSEYVDAAAINTVYKAKDTTMPGDGAITTAKKLMQLDRPGVSDGTLETLSGTTISDMLNLIKNNYQVTADVEDRALSFNEVKQEIDQDKIIEMDAYDANNPATPGTGDNLGHAVSIVGYVMPADGDTTKHAPYYEVWNPWWNKTFYVSANSKTFRLAGVDYKWTRTWHNWRKINEKANVSIDPSIGQQKVASAPNPDAQVQLNGLKPIDSQHIIDNGMTPALSNDNIGNQQVAEYGAPHRIYDIFISQTNFWYAYRSDNKKIMLGIDIPFVEEDNRTNNGAGKFVVDFGNASDNLYKLGEDFGPSVSMAAITAMVSLLSLTSGTEAIAQSTIRAISSLLALFGIKTGIFTLIDDYNAYHNSIENMKKDFVQAMNGQ